MTEVNLGKVMGSRIHFISSASPLPKLGLLNDWAFNTDSGKLWEKLSVGWEYRGSMKVPAVDIPGIAKWNLDINHPVGSWWFSDNPTSPAALFGGTWERMAGKFLLGADGDHPAGSTGGAFTITQTEEQMPRHKHTDLRYYGDTQISIDGGGSAHQLTSSPIGSDTGGTIETGYAGGGQPMDITNPYYATYMWRRTA